MFRLMAVLSTLLGFLIAQTSAGISAMIQSFESAKQHYPTVNVKHQLPDDSDNPMADEEKSDASQYSDDFKALTFQVNIQFILSQVKTLWTNTYFILWHLVSEFERPPRLLS